MCWSKWCLIKLELVLRIQCWRVMLCHQFLTQHCIQASDLFKQNKETPTTTPHCSLFCQTPWEIQSAVWGVLALPGIKKGKTHRGRVGNNQHFPGPGQFLTGPCILTHPKHQTPRKNPSGEIPAPGSELFVQTSLNKKHCWCSNSLCLEWGLEPLHLHLI